MRKDVQAQRLVGRNPGLERDEGLHPFAQHRVGLADHAGLGHGGMLHQRAFDLERADQVAGGLDHVVGTADEPVIAVGVTPGQVAGEVKIAGKALAIARLVVEVAAEHRRPTGTQRQFAFDIGLLDDAHPGRLALGFQMLDDAGLDARQRPTHRARLDLEGRCVGDHDAAGLGLPPVVMDRQPQCFLAPPDGLGVERLAHAGDESQVRIGMAACRCQAGLHQHADRGRRRVPDADAFLLEQGVPALGVEFLAIDQRGHAVQQRRDDAIGHAGHPARIGGAPVAVLGVQVERVAPGRVVGDHGTVHVQGALGRAGGAAGEVQQRGVVCGGRDGDGIVAGRSHQRDPVQCVGLIRAAAVLGHQQHMAQRGHLRAHRLNLAPVQRIGGHQHLALTDVDARGDRLRAERGEQRRHHGAVLQRTQHRDVELGDAPGKHEESGALADTEPPQHLGETMGLARQLGIAQFDRRGAA